MKKFKLVSVLLLALVLNLALASVASAEGGFFFPFGKKDKMEERKEMRGEFQDQMREKRMEQENLGGEDMKGFRGEMKEDRMEFRETMKEDMQAMRKMARVMVTKAFMQRSANFTQIIERIRSRMTKLEANGVDTDAAEELVNKAEDSVETAKDEAELAVKAAEEDKTIEEIRSHLSLAKESLKQATSYLVQALKELKGGHEDDDADASDDTNEEDED